MQTNNTDQVQVLETYNPPLSHWRVDYDTHELCEILILKKQLMPGASLPTYKCRESKAGRKFITGCFDGCAGKPDKAEVLRDFIENIREGIDSECKRITEAEANINKYLAIRARAMRQLMEL